MSVPSHAFSDRVGILRCTENSWNSQPRLYFASVGWTLDNVSLQPDLLRQGLKLYPASSRARQLAPSGCYDHRGHPHTLSSCECTFMRPITLVPSVQHSFQSRKALWIVKDVGFWRLSPVFAAVCPDQSE